MTDHRGRIEKLRAMANQTDSPEEAEIARQKLLAMGAGNRIPPRRPPNAPAPGSGDDLPYVFSAAWDGTFYTQTISTANWSSSGGPGFSRIYVRVRGGT